MRRGHRAWAWLALAGLMALGLYGCGASGPKSGIASALPTCVASQLTLTAASEGAASGHIVTLYHFTNVSRTKCELRGYPGARLLDASGRPLAIQVEQVAQAYTWKTTPVTTIGLTAGSSAWFRAQTSNVTIQSGVTCPVAARTIIFPPGVATGFTSSIHLSTCDGKVYLSPLVGNPNDL